MSEAAKALGVELDYVEVDGPSRLDSAMSRAKERGAQAVYAWPSGFTFSFPKQFAEAARANNLPSMHW